MRRSVKSLRARYRNGPIGTWVTWLPGGEQITHGTNVQFNADGTGTEWHWGGEPFAESTSQFTWKTVGDFRIEITHGDPPPTIVEYDVAIRYDEYNIRQDVISEKCHSSKEILGENGFWISAYPLVSTESESGRAPLWLRFIRLFKA